MVHVERLFVFVFVSPQCVCYTYKCKGPKGAEGNAKCLYVCVLCSGKKVVSRLLLFIFVILSAQKLVRLWENWIDVDINEWKRFYIKRMAEMCVILLVIPMSWHTIILRWCLSRFQSFFLLSFLCTCIAPQMVNAFRSVLFFFFFLSLARPLCVCVCECAN